MADLELLRADHADALLAFERENRAYFAAWIPDRGDGYFAEFAERHAQTLAWIAEGTDYFHVLVEDGEVIGRFNPTHVEGGTAHLGFRVAEKATGRGVARAGVEALFAPAAREYGLRTILAEAAVVNAGSRAVLARTGFEPTGEEVDLNGKPGLRYRRGIAEYA